MIGEAVLIILLEKLLKGTIATIDKDIQREKENKEKLERTA
jgi:hypothetical protein